jgi:hypothetical protein
MTVSVTRAYRDVIITVAEQGQCSLERRHRRYLCNGAACAELLTLLDQFCSFFESKGLLTFIFLGNNVINNTAMRDRRMNSFVYFPFLSGK